MACWWLLCARTWTGSLKPSAMDIAMAMDTASSRCCQLTLMSLTRTSGRLRVL